MAKVISIALQKGGTGKSSTAQVLASMLAVRGFRTLLIDSDSQRNTTRASGITPEHTLTDVYAGDADLCDAVVPVTMFLSVLGADRRLVNMERVNVGSNLLYEHLQGIQSNYDFVIIDTPPALGNLLKNALYASDYVVIPVEPLSFAYDGIEDLYATIMECKNVVGRPEILGLLVTMYDSRTNLTKAIVEALGDVAGKYGTRVFNTRIRRGVALPESQLYQKQLIDYAPKADITKDYTAFTEECLSLMEV